MENMTVFHKQNLKLNINRLHPIIHFYRTILLIQFIQKIYLLKRILFFHKNEIKKTVNKNITTVFIYSFLRLSFSKSN